MKTVAEVIGVSRSNLIERMRERPKKRSAGRRCPQMCERVWTLPSWEDRPAIEARP
jgi:hypothetical protein